MGNAFLSRHPNLPAVLLAAVLAYAVLATADVPPQGYSQEAVERAAVAADVASGASRGPQGLVGSLYLSPLPTLLVILAGLVPSVGETPALSAGVAAGAAALLVICLNALWRAHGVRAALRYPAMVCVMLLPPVVLSVQRGQTAMVFVALAVGGAGAMLGWMRTQSLRQLALSAVLVGLLVITRYQGLLLAAAGTLLVALAAGIHRRGWRYVEGITITFAVPWVYAVTLWVGGNWLVLGDPLFFIRPLTSSLALGVTTPRAALAWDCPWALLGLLLAAACLPALIGSVLRPGRRGWPQNAAACVALLGLVAAAWFAHLPTGRPAALSDAPHVVRLLEGAYPNGTFIVTGYAGYGFVDAAGRDPQHRWVHIMHLRPENVAKVLADYQGREVFLLVSASRVQDRWDRVGLNWGREGERIPERFLFSRRVGEWIVFEVLRTGGPGA